VLLTVIPAGGVDIGSIVSRMRSGEDEVRFDRVAVAYSQISHVLVSKVRPMPAPSSLATFRPAQADSENDET
jgi:hypothetical protein